MRQKLASLWAQIKAEFRITHPYGLWEIVSVSVATPIALYVCVLYVQSGLKETSDEFWNFGLTAIVLTAALGALSGQLATIVENQDDNSFTYAAERFAHASLAFIQTLIAVYARGFVTNASWMSELTLWKFVVDGIFSLVVFYVSGFGVWSWFWGFRSLNSALWSSFKRPYDD